MHPNAGDFSADELNLLIIGILLREPEATFKGIAAKAKVDQRTVARRVNVMRRNGVIRSIVEIDWKKLGIDTAAYIGCTTSQGERSVARIREYLKSDPRIVECYETVGAYQYILRVLSRDLQSLRDSVLRDLEPMTTDLVASVVSADVKGKDQFRFVRYLRESRYPKTRSAGWGYSRGSRIKR
jgi:DNA-binding Lrp family transcriptional regulator